MISLSEEACNGFSLVFEHCNNGEKYYCLQRFVYYSLWSEEEYTNAMNEIEDYRRQGACIIATLAVGKVDLTWNKRVVPPMLSVLEKADAEVLYYIIVPERQVTGVDKEYLFDAMLSYLGFRVYPDIVCRMCYLPCVCFTMWNIFMDKEGFLAFLNWAAFLVFFGLFALGARDFCGFFIIDCYRRKYSFRHQVTLLDKNQYKEVNSDF